MRLPSAEDLTDLGRKSALLWLGQVIKKHLACLNTGSIILSDKCSEGYAGYDIVPLVLLVFPSNCARAAIAAVVFPLMLFLAWQLGLVMRL